MANLSCYLENKLIDQVFRGLSYGFPSSVYIALCTGTITNSSTGSTLPEVSITGTAYARQTVSCQTNTWASTNGSNTGASTGNNMGTTSNIAAITFPTATSDWGTIVSVAVMDNTTMTVGNMLFWAPLTEAKVVGNGDTFQFSIGNLSIQMT